MIMRSEEDLQLGEEIQSMFEHILTQQERFNCERSMNLCLLKSLWAWDSVYVYFSAWARAYACECVLPCEHCAFIIFNVIPESRWKAANEAHWVSELQ